MMSAVMLVITVWLPVVRWVMEVEGVGEIGEVVEVVEVGRIAEVVEMVIMRWSVRGPNPWLWLPRCIPLD